MFYAQNGLFTGLSMRLPGRPAGDAMTDAASGLAKAQSLLTALLRGTTVLLVEDDADVCEATRFLFEDFGVRVLIAHDGADALAQLRTELPDLIVSDVHMPRLDGYQLLQRLRDDPRTSHLPIIALSADAAGDGFDASLRKPFDDGGLCDAVRTVMLGRPALFKRQRAVLRKYATQLRSVARSLRRAPAKSGPNLTPGTRDGRPYRARTGPTHPAGSASGSASRQTCPPFQPASPETGQSPSETAA
jgi:CheY-like chemotaxis protein